ncbi:hypothetical protein BS78_07G199600 [Paspalum vaginatum]|nr:hypothetical protein BS78_07G199600 [Paspalum vaginatum]
MQQSNRSDRRHHRRVLIDPTLATAQRATGAAEVVGIKRKLLDGGTPLATGVSLSRATSRPWYDVVEEISCSCLMRPWHRSPSPFSAVCAPPFKKSKHQCRS